MKATSLNLSMYLNKIVKITLQQNIEVPYIHGTFIALLQYDNIAKCYVLNHPYNVKTKSVDSGIAAFDATDVKKIYLGSQDDIRIFIWEYKKFHDSVVKEFGNDSCALEPSDLLTDLKMV